MSRVCEFSGKKVQYGNRVSHANNKTRHRFMPNLQNISFLSDTLGAKVKVKLSANAVRSVEKKGGIDNYLASADQSLLSKKFRQLKKIIMKKAFSISVIIFLYLLFI